MSFKFSLVKSLEIEDYSMKIFSNFQEKSLEVITYNIDSHPTLEMDALIG